MKKRLQLKELSFDELSQKKKTIKEIREYERSLNTYWASSEEQVDLEEYKKQEARKNKETKK